MDKKVEKFEKDAKEVAAMGKLKKERVDIDINPKKFLLAFTQDELNQMEKQSVDDLTKEEVEFLENAKKNHKENIEKYSQARLQAVMVPLKYKDLQIIKNGIFEAIQSAKQYNWDDSVKIRAMIREERTLTVFLSLKKKEDISKPYYDSLEEISQETDTAIDELYNLYLENFVLSEQERKNS